MGRNDQTGYAKESILRLKNQEMDSEILKEIGCWYASIKSKEALFWLKTASDSGVKNLEYFNGLVYFDYKQFDQALKCFLNSLNYDPIKSLQAIDNLEYQLSMDGEWKSKLSFDIRSSLIIAEAHLLNGNIVKAANWFVKAAKLGSFKDKRCLREMIGKRAYKSAQYIIGEYFEELQEIELAMKCYKRGYSINNEEDKDEILPWEHTDDKEDDDGGTETEQKNASSKATIKPNTG